MRWFRPASLQNQQSTHEFYQISEMRESEMAEERRDKESTTAILPQKKLVYAVPQLQEFGRLHLQTQGNNGTAADVGNQMTMM